MKTLALIITLTVGLCCTAYSQTDAFGDQIRDYLMVNGTLEQYSGAYDSMFELMRTQFEPDTVPAQVWEALSAKKGEEMDQVLSLLSSVYRKHFTASDITRMKQHYTLQGAEREADKSDFLNSVAGKKMIKVQGALIEEIGKTSEFWSRDLYLNTMNALKDQGYFPNGQ